MGGIYEIEINMAAKMNSPMATDSEEGETTYTGEHSSSLTTSTTFNTTSRLNATRVELEKRQLAHSIQLLKLELSQKDMIIEALKTEHGSNIDELEEKLGDMTCERNLLQQKLRAMTHVYEEELKEMKKQIRNSVSCTVCESRESDVHVRQNRNESLPSVPEELKLALRKPLLTEEEYNVLYNVTETDLGITDLARVRLFEASKPFIDENEFLRKEMSKLQDNLTSNEEKHDQLMKSFEELKCVKAELSTQCEELSQSNETLSASVKYNNFKINNFDIVKRERDELQKEMDTIRRTLIEKEISEKIKQEESQKVHDELSSSVQSIALLKQDKDYLSKQVNELGARCRDIEEKNTLLLEQLSNIKQSKEDLYEQFIRTRQNQKDEYGQQLSNELENMRQKTALEVDHVKRQTREMFERENKILQESKERADNERDKAEGKLRDMEQKYDVLMAEFRQLQLSSEGQISDFQSELQMKVFECERVHLLQEETNKSLTVAVREKNKLREKIESLTEDIHRVTAEKDSKLREYESALKEKSQRLETYENLEQDLDDVVIQAAKFENEQDAEKVLLSFGFGTSVPSTSRRRLQQSVQLARRVLKLERINSSLKQQLDKLEKEKKVLTEQAVNMSSRLSMTHQPQKYLVDTVHYKDKEIRKLDNRNSALEGRIRELEKERSRLLDMKNMMTVDLEQLLSHNEELSVMKKLLTSMTSKNDKLEKCRPKHVSMDSENIPQ